MEVLTDILSGLRAAGSVYFCDQLVPPWELRYQGESRAMFHLLRRGRCTVSQGAQSMVLDAGDFAFFAPGIDHVLRPTAVDDAPALLLCGYCRFDAVAQDVLLDALPQQVVIRSEDFDAWPWLWRTLEHLTAEFQSGAPGSELTVNKLTEVLLVQLIRADFGRNADNGIMAALKDPRLRAVLQALHEKPGQPWTIELAAGKAALSRSAFARRFKDVLGLSFFDYLTQLRMRAARSLLLRTALPVTHIAEQVGYLSEPAFVKAFKKVHQLTPRAFRLNGARVVT